MCMCKPNTSDIQSVENELLCGSQNIATEKAT